MDARQPDTTDPLALAPTRVRIAPPPEWLSPSQYNQEFKPKIRGSATHLLIERQIHAELRQSYVHQAVRLETLEAVQHWSQWRTAFEPQTQSLTLHSLKVRRGSVDSDRLSLEHIQFLRREAGLEGLHIDGWITLLALLEDVVVGDVIEWSYTIEDHPRLMSQYCDGLFALPPGAEIGKHLFSARYAENRPMKWRSSIAELTPSITTKDGETCCSWSGETTVCPAPEECIPAWQIVSPWMQVSDFPDWATIGREVSNAWSENGEGPGLAGLLEEITSSSPELLGRVNRAIEMLQDGFRFLTVDVGFGGQIPAPVETVIRRRYGDCKNLANLLARVLRGLGVQARPVLVHGTWRKSVSLLLPSPSAFNHAVVEYELDGQTRWVDATLQSQGGGALDRSILDFGFGLPIDPNATGLIPVPRASLPAGEYEVRESFFLDTAGNPSNLGLSITAKGFYADQLRREFESKGVEALAKERLQGCANRFSKAGRLGALQHRDDRARNEFTLAEAFEITGFLKNDGVPGVCVFEFFSFATAGALLRPSANPRRHPFAIPFPCRQTHIIEIEFASMDPPNPPIYRVSNEFFSFSRRSKSLHNYFRITFSLETLADSVLPAGLDKLRKEVEGIWQASSFRVRLPVGQMKMRRPRDFGSLPTPSRTSATPAPAQRETPKPPTLPAAPPTPAIPATTIAPVALANQSTLLIAVDTPKSGTEKPAFINPMTASSLTRQWSAVRGQTPRPHSSRKRGVNRKCTWSLWFLVGSVLAFALSVMLSRTRDLRALGGVTFLLAIVSGVWAVILAIMGLSECFRQPNRFPRGKVTGFITLTGAGCLVCLVLLGLTGVLRGVVSGGRVQHSPARAQREILKFTAQNFVFYSPEVPWQQVDARKFGSATLVAFARPGPVFFSVLANRLEPGYPDPRARAVHLFKLGDQRVSSSYRLISEQEVVHNGLSGWLVEFEAAFQGHEYHVARWILATNGFGYALSTWASPNLSNQVNVEADRLCGNFEPTRPAQ